MICIYLCKIKSVEKLDLMDNDIGVLGKNLIIIKKKIS